MIIKVTSFFLICFFFALNPTWGGIHGGSKIVAGKIDLELARIVYTGGESFKYDISWTGGIKIGELLLSINKASQCDDCYEINTTISSSGGIIHLLYPVKDIHTTLVSGDERLPFFGEIWQKEGRGYEAHKVFQYDQINHVVVKSKEGGDINKFELDGVVHNEFSSFFASRIMDLKVGVPFTVPTFGDDMRHEVMVVTLKKESIENLLLGNVKTLRVTPILPFSGLYDKKGDTTIWYSDDECRVPVLIRSKILIGSLTANLVEYSNQKCQRYSHINKRE